MWLFLRLGSHRVRALCAQKLAATISRDDPGIPSEDRFGYHSSGSREYCKWMVKLYQGKGGQACIRSCYYVATWRSQCSSHRLDQQHPVWSPVSVSDESLINPLRSLDSAASSTFSVSVSCIPFISVSCIPFGLCFSGDHEALQGSGSRPLVFAVEREEGWNTYWISWILQIPSGRNCFKTCSLQ